MRDTAGKQTIYDVIIDATINKLGGWKQVTPEDALKVSQEKSVLDTYHHVSAIFQVTVTTILTSSLYHWFLVQFSIQLF